MGIKERRTRATDLTADDGFPSAKAAVSVRSLIAPVSDSHTVIPFKE